MARYCPMEPYDDGEGSNSTVEMEEEDDAEDMEVVQVVTLTGPPTGKATLVMPSRAWREYYKRKLGLVGGEMRPGTLGQVIIDIPGRWEGWQDGLGAISQTHAEEERAGDVHIETGETSPMDREGKGQGGDRKGSVTPLKGSPLERFPRFGKGEGAVTLPRRSHSLAVTPGSGWWGKERERES